MGGSGALTSCRTEPRQTGNRPTEENNWVTKRAMSGVIHQPAHSFSTKRSEMTMGMCVRSLFVPAQIKYCVPNHTMFLNNRIGSKFLFGYSVGCIFHARTEHSGRLFCMSNRIEMRTPNSAVHRFRVQTHQRSHE